MRIALTAMPKMWRVNIQLAVTTACRRKPNLQTLLKMHNWMSRGERKMQKRGERCKCGGMQLSILGRPVLWARYTSSLIGSQKSCKQSLIAKEAELATELSVNFYFLAPEIPTTQIMWFLPVKQNRKLSKFCSNCFKWVSNYVGSICQIIALYQMQYCDDGCI